MSFWGELKRRNVVRVGIAYLIASWLILQVIDVVAPILELPNWISRAILLILAVGFVVAIILAWAYELTPQGIRRDEDARTDEATKASSRRGNGFYVAAGSVALVISAGLYWYSGNDERWARNYALPQIEIHIENGDWESAFKLANDAGAIIPDDESLAGLWNLFSYSTSIPSEPTGASVSRRPYNDPDAEWQNLGITPLVNVRLPIGFSVLRIELDGHESLLRVIGTESPRSPNVPVLDRRMPGYAFAIPETFRLDPINTIPNGFTWVSGMDVEIQGSLVSFADYYISKSEVTNSEFKEFVDADGYERAEYWQHDVVIDGEVVSWADAMATFTDRTGRPGPSTWEAGTFPDGEMDFPVAGVSWYEAAAYARFAGRELPTVLHWRKSFSMALLSAMLPVSNLQSAGAMPVTKSAGISFTGLYDMVGNVREWSFNEVDDQRAILGGGWNDAYYIAQESISDPGSLPPADRSATNGFRLAFTIDDSEVIVAAQAPIVSEEIRPNLTPVNDEVFQLYRSAFDYDAGRLEPVVESSEDFGDWRRETVTISSAYSDERITVLLDLPNNGSDVFQPIVYWPGTGAFFFGSTDLSNHRLEFLLKNGRAVVYPIYAGTFERRRAELPSWSTMTGRDLAIEEVKDFRRTIDYLETRPDIDRQNIGYFGSSWGGRVGAMVLAVEPRRKGWCIGSGRIQLQRAR